MYALSPFAFEGLQVRVVTGEDGQPWFVAKDVCEALGYANPWDAVAKHVDPEDLAKREVLTLGGTQEMTTINESGVYALVFGSKLDGAKRFKRWITAEVLPSIRKTGSYRVSNGVSGELAERTAAAVVVSEGVQRILANAGVSPGIAAAGALQVLKANTMVDTELARKLLPANDVAIAAMNPTALGKELDMKAAAVNKRLEALGMQRKNERGEWELTEAGREHGEALPYASGKHSGYQVLWKPSVLEILRRSAA